jgi:hypothetical protein
MQRRFGIEELTLPYLLLSFPVDDIAFLDRASKCDISKVFAFVKF